MKVLLFLGLVGAAIYGGLVLSSDYLLPRDAGQNAFAGQSLGNPSDRQLRSWGTDLPSLASSSSRICAPLAEARRDVSIFPFSQLGSKANYHTSRRHIPADRMGQGRVSR